MNIYDYPYDSTGTNPDNRINEEAHRVQPPTDYNDVSFIVPRAAPFFKQNFVIRLNDPVNGRVLLPDVDFIFTHAFPEMLEAIGKLVYGSIMFLNPQFSGMVYLSYNTVGGEFTLDDVSIIETLTRSLYNARFVTWGQIKGIPQSYPPLDHPHDFREAKGFNDLIVAINSLAQSVLTRPPHPLIAELTEHITSLEAHDKSAVGLSNVQNYAIATPEEARGGLNDRYVTPQLVKLIIDHLVNAKMQKIEQDLATIKQKLGL